MEGSALTLVHDLTALCAKGGFRLNKWVSNSQVVIASIPKEKRAKEIKDLDLDQDIQWCMESDLLQFKIVIQFCL